jgi:hypothetical protein
LESDGTLPLGGIEQVRNDRILGDRLGHVLFSVVGPYLFPVDVLLENVAEHVRVDFPSVAQGARVEVPVVLIKEREKPLERLIGNVDADVLLLQHMHLEQPPIEIGDIAEQLFQVSGALGWLLSKAFVKQT